MQCRTLVAQLGRLNVEFGRENAQILIILGDTLERAGQYGEQLKAPFPILADPERDVYHQFELTKDFVGLQRTAAIVVDPAGIIRYIKRIYNPLPWLQESQELLEAVKAVGAS